MPRTPLVDPGHKLYAQFGVGAEPRALLTPAVYGCPPTSFRWVCAGPLAEQLDGVPVRRATSGPGLRLSRSVGGAARTPGNRADQRSRQHS
jgi:hypothetical protein